MKHLLVVINPCAGMKTGMRYLPDILKIFADHNYLSTVLMTRRSGDAKKFVQTQGALYDRVVCIGGDGTFNEVVAGLIAADLHDKPLGYIPAGSTNDFARSLKLSLNVLQAAKDAVNPQSVITRFDTGLFDERVFTYVASFGAFTKASYSAPQNVKNMLGHLAYILEGIKDLPSISKIPMTLMTDHETFQGEYLFGAISNSTSLGGLLHLDTESVDMSDGQLELLLIKAPNTAMDLVQMIHCLNMKKYDSCDCITFCSTPSITVRSRECVDWTLDGEKQSGKETIQISNLHHAISLIVPPTTMQSSALKQ